jgi:hypothetical protein
MKQPPIPGCLWVADNLLVRTGKAAKLTLPQALLKRGFAAGITCAVNLLSKQEFLNAGAYAHFGPLSDALGDQSDRQRRELTKVSMSYFFWPAKGCLPSARRVRQAIDSIEVAHTIGLRVLVNGMGEPARAAIVAGCWLAREGYGGDLEGERLSWLEHANDTPGGKPPPCVLSSAERTYVSEWPTGRDGQPDLAHMERAERDEVFPFASVEHWLSVLPSIRVYTARGQVRPVDVPVVNGQRASDGADIDLDLEELRRGVWIGERTMRLPNGWEVVFNSPHR